jgi:hypothetical protein
MFISFLVSHIKDADTGDVEYVPSPTVDTAHTGLIASIDGNVELQDAPSLPTTNRIKINITRQPMAPQPQIVNENSSDSNLVSNSDNELMKHDTTENVQKNNNKDDELINEIHYDLKATLEGVVLTKTKAYRGGHEQSGLCSIM